MNSNSSHSPDTAQKFLFHISHKQFRRISRLGFEFCNFVVKRFAYYVFPSLLSLKVNKTKVVNFPNNPSLINKVTCCPTENQSLVSVPRNYVTSTSTKHKSAIWSRYTGKPILRFQSCQLTITWMCTIKYVSCKQRSHASVDLLDRA